MLQGREQLKEQRINIMPMIHRQSKLMQAKEEQLTVVITTSLSCSCAYMN